jgi:hypothetical protein
MKQSLVVSALASALIALVPAASAPAAEITYISINGFWHDPIDNVPGVQAGDPVINNGSPTSSITWGTTTGSQSGYDFTGTLPGPFQFPGPVPFFSLGNFTRKNSIKWQPSWAARSQP